MFTVANISPPTNQVSSRKDIESDVLSHPNPVHFTVESLEAGEKRVRLAIDKGEAFNLGLYRFKVVTHSRSISF